MSNDLTTRPKKQIIIGIDPDTQGAGWACINITDRTIHLEQLTIPKIVRLLQEWRNEVDEQYLDTDYSYRFVLENVWETSHNRHIVGQVNAQAIAKTGYNVGRCSMVGEILRDLITDYEFPIICQPPLRKVWKGKNGKITHEELLMVCKHHRLTLPKHKQRATNQEDRDALLLAIHHIATPIKGFNG